MAKLCMVLIRGYRRYISPGLPMTCRFVPTCSQYALEAFARWGFFKGLYLAVRRVLRCHPWGGGGYDPVPGRADACDPAEDCLSQ